MKINTNKSKILLVFVISLIFLLLISSVRANNDTTKTLQLVAIVSDIDQNQPQPIWNTIFPFQPDIFLFMGDTIHTDTEDENELRAQYDKLTNNPDYKALTQTNIPIIATWDDHDLGKDDAGADYPFKEQSKKIFLDFFNEPLDSVRRKRQGVYDAKIFGPPDKQIQIIALDTRYSRTNPKKKNSGYIANNDPTATILGEEQWKWLEAELQKPAQIRIIMSSIQVIAKEHSWEKWMNFPLERAKLFKLIRDTKANGVIFISGDRHIAELSVIDGGVGYPLYDLTVGSLNKAAKKLMNKNSYRIKMPETSENFGLINIDWRELNTPLITLEIRNKNKSIAIQRRIPLSILQQGVLRNR